MRTRVLRAFLVALAALAMGAALAPGAWAAPLTVTVSGTPDHLIGGDLATLTATVTNLTGSDAQNVRVSFSLIVDPFVPPPTISSAASCIGIGPSGHPLTLSCLLASGFPAGATGQISADVSNPGLGEVPVDVAATPESGADPSAYIRWRGTWEPKADTKLDLSSNAESIQTGGQVTIRALVTNTTAEATAYGALVKFSIPPEATVVSRPDDCTGTALSLVCPLGDLGPSLTAQRLIVLRSTQEGAFTVLGTTTWARPDPTIVDTQGQVTVTVVAPPDTSTPEPTPTPAPTAVSTKARAAGFGTLVTGAPGTRRCIRARKLSIVLRSIKNVDPVRATIKVTGRKRALVLKGSKARRPFTLKLPRSGKATVSLTVTLESGRRYTAKRTYRLC